MATTSSNQHTTRTANGNDNDNDSFSSDSDDEFLTMRQDGKGALDREALIRKKLLENFYGKSKDDPDDDHDDDDDDHASTSNNNRKKSSEDDDDSNSNSSSAISSPNPTTTRSSKQTSLFHPHEQDVLSKTSASAAAAAAATGTVHKNDQDLDSPHFHALGHTSKHVLGSTVHELLDTEEQLACQVRMLDSSMQTLVYENYSRFIDATDAIRSIGMNVQAKEQGIQSLQSNITTICDVSTMVESSIGTLRDVVVEKLRIKRLLLRLDTLLKLPTTLSTQIANGKYRLAAKSYISAYTILSKHSKGFESLQQIESKCQEIVTTLLQQIHHKLIHWSGSYNTTTNTTTNTSSSNYYDAQEDNHDTELQDEDSFGTSRKHSNDDDHDEAFPPDPPKSMSEIFECAGTPILLLSHESIRSIVGPSTTNTTTTTTFEEENAVDSNDNGTKSMVRFLYPGLSMDQCKEMALEASLRLLERVLDTHHIELQEWTFSQTLQQPPASTTTTTIGTPARKDHTTIDKDGGGGASPLRSNKNTTSTNSKDGSTSILPLIPTHVLDSILQASTLYSMSFGTNNHGVATTATTTTTTGPTPTPTTTTSYALAESDRQRLADFVSEAFGSFLQHVRGALLEHSLMAQQRKELVVQQEQQLQRHLQKQRDQDTSGTISRTLSNDTADTNNNITTTTSNRNVVTIEEEQDDNMEEQAYEQIATAMTILLQSVQQLASGLTLPEVGLDSNLASSLIDQTINLTQAMVRRRVDQKFYSLRFRVIQNCLEPFCYKAMMELEEQGSHNNDNSKQAETKTTTTTNNNNTTINPARVLQVVQLASVALSDSLQLVDDTVRSILSSATATTPTTAAATTTTTTTTIPTTLTTSSSTNSNIISGVDSTMLKQAVETSTRRFAMWLATAMEVLAGCESSHPKWTVEVPAQGQAQQQQQQHHHYLEDFSDPASTTNIFDMTSTTSVHHPIEDDVSEVSDDPKGPTMLLENALLDLSEQIEQIGSKTARSDMTLAIAEMCRVAERSVMDNIFQSIAIHGGGGKHHTLRKSKSPFSTTTTTTTSTTTTTTTTATTSGAGVGGLSGGTTKAKNPTSERFRLAASRVLGLYAMNRGAEAANLLCLGLSDLTTTSNSSSSSTTEYPQAPRSAAWQVLELVKLTSYDCADLFGGSKRAGPVPDMLDDDGIFGTGGASSYHLSQKSQARSGLAFDVERMFSEAVLVYPHPSECIEFTRNVVLTIMLKVAFKALVETIRHISLSANGLHQLMVDVEFLKFMVPHYVKDELISEGCSARTVLLRLLNDAIETAAEQPCAMSEDAEQDTDWTHHARSVVREFMTVHDGPHGLLQRFVIAED